MMGDSGFDKRDNSNPIPGLYLLAVQDIFTLLDHVRNSNNLKGIRIKERVSLFIWEAISLFSKVEFLQISWEIPHPYYEILNI